MTPERKHARSRLKRRSSAGCDEEKYIKLHESYRDGATSRLAMKVNKALFSKY
jgi:hypothetical protein